MDNDERMDSEVVGHSGLRRTTSALLLVLVFVGAFATAFALGAETAEAYPLRKGKCDGRENVHYTYSGSGWNTTYEGWFSYGASRWDVIRGATGSKYTASGPTGNIDIWRLNLQPPAAGVTNCDGWGNLHSITIDTDVTDEAVFKGVSVHEVGHAHGLAHTGESDSFDSQMPTMECGYHSGDTSLEQDDWAQLTSTFSSSAHANQSFEHGFSFWGKGGGAVAYTSSSGGNDGPGYTYFKNYGAYIFQTVRVTDPDDLTARVNYKKWNASDYGTIQFDLYSRRLDYTNGSGCNYYNSSWDMDDPSIIQGWKLQKVTWYTPTTSWKWNDQPQWTTVGIWDGVDVRVYVRNHMRTSSGGNTYIRIDHTRARHT